MTLPIAQPRPGPGRAASTRAPSTRAGRRGFTLGELAVSLGLVSVLLVAMGSVLVVSGRAVGVSAAHAGDAKADDALAVFAAEHRLAQTILERTATTIAFTVPDRDGDTDVETIRYAWSGVAGHPLTRQYNDEPAAAVIPQVRSFALHHIDRTTTAPPPKESESNEVLFVAHAPDAVTPSPNPNFNVTVSNSTTATYQWVAQYFKPVFPADKKVVSYQVTRVRFRPARVVSTSSTAYWNCQVWLGSSSQVPTGGAIEGESVRVNMSSLPAGAAGTTASIPAFYEMSFAKAVVTDPAAGACFVVVLPSLTSTGVVATERNGPTMTAGTHFLIAPHTSSGKSWTIQSGQDMYFEVYGKYRYLEP